MCSKSSCGKHEIQELTFAIQIVLFQVVVFFRSLWNIGYLPLPMLPKVQLLHWLVWLSVNEPKKIIQIDGIVLLRYLEMFSLFYLIW